MLSRASHRRGRPRLGAALRSLLRWRGVAGLGGEVGPNASGRAALQHRRWQVVRPPVRALEQHGEVGLARTPVLRACADDRVRWGWGVHSACTPRRLGLPGCAALGAGTLGVGTRAAHVSTRALPRGRLPCASGASGACSGQPAGTRTLHVLSTAVALLDLTTCQHGSRAVLRQLRQLLGRRLLTPAERVDGRLERLQLTRVALPAGRRSRGRLLLLQLL